MSFFWVLDVDNEWIEQYWSINYLCKYKPSQKPIPFFPRELRGSVSLITGPKPLLQSDAFDMKLKFYFHANKTHFHRTSLYQTSFWKWEFLEIGNGLLHIYFRSLLHKDAKKFDERQENWHLLKEEKSQWQIQGSSRTSPYGHLSNTDSSLGPGKMPIHSL